MNTESAIVAGVALGAVVSFAWRWRKRYVLNIAERRIRMSIPEDVIYGAEISLDDIEEFDSIVDFTCMLPCCYDAEENDAEVWLDPDDLQ